MSSSSAGGGGDGGGLSSRPVHAYFKRLNLNANERWVEAAIAEVRRANAAGMSAILKSCYERWIGCDISTDDVQETSKMIPVAAALPTTRKLTLPAPRVFALQVLSSHDVGRPVYGQLQTLLNVKDENSRVSAEDDTQRPAYTANWQPKEKRMLKLQLTDGRRTISALEHVLLPQLPDDVPVGAKITVAGPVVCRRGVLMLADPSAVKYHGGSIIQPEERHEGRVEMLKSALDRNHSSGDGSAGGSTGGGLATQQYVQKSKSLLLKSGERVERLPMTTFATANGARSGAPGNAADGGEDFDADDALFAEMEIPGEAPVNSSAYGNENDPFGGDDEDDFFSQVHMPSPPPTSFTRVRGGRARAGRGGRGRGGGATPTRGGGRGRGRGRGSGRARGQDQQGNKRPRRGL